MIQPKDFYIQDKNLYKIIKNNLKQQELIKNMGLFDNILSEEESLIIDDTPLDFDYVPKIIKYREKEQFAVANCIKPLFNNRTGKNIIVHGPPGIGKSVAIKNVLNELEEETDEINVFYINCWKSNTSYKVLLQIADQYGYKFTQNKKTLELYNLLEKKLNSNKNVFVFDEIDKATELDFLYFILERIIKKSIILITNFKSWFINMDMRIKSRLIPELLEFKEYNLNEIKGILNERIYYAFRVDSWEKKAIGLVAKKTYELKDIRAGLFLLKESGLIAEQKALRKITTTEVELAVQKLNEFTQKKIETLDETTKKIFLFIKENNNKKIGELFNLFTQKQKISYKTFQRKINKLAEGNFIDLEKHTGKGGNTTIIKLKN